jgi:hypothetical protein
MNQVADRATSGASDKLVKDAVNQAMGHLEICRSMAGSTLDGPAKEFKAAAGDKAKLAASAKTISGLASNLMTAVATLKPGAENTAGILNKVVADTSIGTDAGLRGAQQQALSLASLAGSLKKGGNPAGIDDVQKMIDEQLLANVGDESTYKPDDYNKAVQALAAKMAPLLKNAQPVDLK